MTRHTCSVSLEQGEAGIASRCLPPSQDTLEVWAKCLLRGYCCGNKAGLLCSLLVNTPSGLLSIWGLPEDTHSTGQR